MSKPTKRPRASSPVPPAFPASTSTAPDTRPTSTSTAQPPAKKTKKSKKSKRVRLAHLADGPTGSEGFEFSEEQRKKLEDESAKDEEERRLEEMLFGKPKRRKVGKGKGKEEEEHEGEPEESGMGHLEDADLFFMDAPAGDDPMGDLPETDIIAAAEDAALELSGSGDSEDEDEEDANEFGGFSSSSEAEPDEPASPPPSSAAAHPLAALAMGSKKKPAAWTDPSDSTLQISLASSNRLRKLRVSADEDAVSGKEYELRLRRQFEKLQPAPAWAKPSKKKRQARETEEGDTEELDDLLHGTADLVRADRPTALPSGELLLTRLADGNLASPTAGAVHSASFHPTLPVLLTAGADRRAKLFSIDGVHNPLLQSLHLADLPLTHAVFHPSGDSIFLAGPRPYFYTYDLASGSLSRSPRGLWGSPGARNPGSEEADRSLEISEFSPDGRTLAVGGRRGHVYFVDTRSGGASAQVTGGVKLNSGVVSLRWAQPQGKELIVVGEDAEVYLFDVAERRCVRRWRDDGAYGASALEVSRDGQRMAIGARTGIVSLYDAQAARYGPSEGTTGNPKPVKTVMNLTTRITSLRFNNTTEILALASKDRKDQLRMMHVPSNTVFFNWPTSGTPLGHVTSVDFSSGSEYVAVGNTRGRVLLYQLRHYMH